MCSDFVSRKTRICHWLGMVLIVSGVVGVFYAGGVSLSQYLYHEIKFRDRVQAFPDALAQAERAYAMYPHNYHMSSWVAQEAWYEHAQREAAEAWVNRGVSQNPWMVDLRWLETILLGQEDAIAAARNWEQYSDWVFWNRWVLAGRVYWYAWAGRLEEGAHYLAFLQGNVNHGWAKEALDAARARP